MAYIHYTELRVWQRAMDLAEACYGITGHFPRAEIFGLASQIRRAAASVTGNIAEGHGRATDGEFQHSLSVARGSLNETDNFVRLAQRLGYVSEADAAPVYAMTGEVGRMLVRLQQEVRRRRTRSQRHPPPPQSNHQ